MTRSGAEEMSGTASTNSEPAKVGGGLVVHIQETRSLVLGVSAGVRAETFLQSVGVANGSILGICSIGGATSGPATRSPVTYRVPAEPT